MQAKDVMTQSVVTIAPWTLISDVATLLRAERISGVPVLQDGLLVGMVSEKDLVPRDEIGTDRHLTLRPWWQRLFASDSGPALNETQDRSGAQYVRSYGLRARDIMSSQVTRVREETPLDEIAALFDQQHVGRVPVMRGRRLVGIVSRADLGRAIAKSSDASEPASVPTDEAIRARLLNDLAHQSWWRANWLSVDVVDGVVSFNGLVEGEDERQAARAAAKNVPGVRRVVDDRMQVSQWVPLDLTGDL